METHNSPQDNVRLLKLVTEFLKNAYREFPHSKSRYVRRPIGFVLMVTGEDGDVTVLGKGVVNPEHFKLLQALISTDIRREDDTDAIISMAFMSRILPSISGFSSMHNFR